MEHTDQGVRWQRRVADWVTVLDRSLITEGPPAETLALDRVLALIPSAGEGRARR